MKAANAILLCWMLAGCASGGNVSHPAHIEQMSYDGLSQCIRISNGSIEAILAPQVGGRMLRFATVGGNNLLWNNPSDPAIDASKYRNWGGEKSWPWPQDDWPQRYGRGWPPASEAEIDPYDCEVVNDGIKMTSHRLAGYDLRIVRQFHIDPQSDELIEEMSFEPAGPAAGQLPTAVWSIAEVPITAQIFARGGGELRRLGFSGKSWDQSSIGRMMVIQRPSYEAKVGLDADLLGVVIGRQLLTVQYRTVSPDAGKYITGERAQLYCKPDASNEPGGLPGFTELEFTSPKGNAATEPVNMTLIWKIETLSDKEATDTTGIAKRLEQRPK